MGHSAQIVLNAADEILVDYFLNGKIKYTEIPKYVEIMLNKHKPIEINSIEQVLELDKNVREELISLL